MSFSAIITEYDSGEAVGSSVLLFQLLGTFSRKVKHLELVHCCLGCENPRRDPEEHLCKTLVSIMPQLESLRIARTPICSKLFSTINKDCPSLSAIVINNMPSEFSHPGMLDQDYQMDELMPGLQDLTASIDRARKKHLPALVTMLICGASAYSSGRNRATRNFRYSYKMDILKHTTTLYPIYATDQKYHFYITWVRWCCPVSGKTMDLVEHVPKWGTSMLLEQSEPVAWTRMDRGIRLPKNVFITKRNYQPLPMCDVAPMDIRGREILARWDRAHKRNQLADLLDAEKKAGRQLLCPKVLDSLEVKDKYLVANLPGEEGEDDFNSEHESDYDYSSTDGDDSD